MNSKEVKRISEISKHERWPYPKTFQELINAGVTSYRTNVADGRTVYVGEGDQYEEWHESLSPPLKISARFQAEAVKRGLKHHQKNQTSYSDFLKDMADAGVHYYDVDMDKRTINYTSSKPGETYVEEIT